MGLEHDANGLPTKLITERLVLRAADPDSDADCQLLIRIMEDSHAGSGGNSRVGVRSLDEVRYKHKVHGPKQKYCTASTAPKSIYWLIFLPTAAAESSEDDDLAGLVVLSTRDEAPCPDMGYAVLNAHAGHGYAAEAGKSVLRYWQDTVGVKEIFCATLEDNIKSQKCAERIGFVRGGTIQVLFGRAPNYERTTGAAYVLPGMEWSESTYIMPTVGWKQEEPDAQPGV